MITPNNKNSSASMHVQRKAYSRFLQNQQNAASKDQARVDLQAGERSQLLQSYEDIDYRVFNGYITDLVKTEHGAPQGFAKAELRRYEAKLKAFQAKNATPAACEDVGGLSAEKALLTPAKSQSRYRDVLDKETQQIQRFIYDKKVKDFVEEFNPAQARLESFELQTAAREVLKGITKPSAENPKLEVPRYRVCNCMRSVVGGVSDVSVISSTHSDSVRYAGLQTCGSVWHCKICATRVSEVRKLEIRSAVDQHLAAGGGVILNTNTVPHGKNDDLRLMLKTMFDVIWPRYINHRAYKRIRKSVGYVGRIRAVEVTWSAVNGWHPHVHEIWFLEKPLSKADIENLHAELYPVWRNTVKNAGLKSPSAKHGLHIQGAESAADYIAKFGTEPRWELSKELAKSHLKKSKDRNGKTPFDLLRDFIETGSKYSADLFREYAEAFAGQTQLYWSQGLKAKFAIGELSDEEIAAHQDYDAVTVATISITDWRLILRSNDRGLVLELARHGGASAVELFLVRLRTMYKSTAAIG